MPRELLINSMKRSLHPEGINEEHSDLTSHCEEHSDEAISKRLIMNCEIAALRSR